MKPLKLLSFVLLMVFASCTNRENELSVNNQNPWIRSNSELRDIALGALELTNGGVNTRTGNIDVKSVEPVLTPFSRGGSESEPLFFVVNYTDNKGFCVVAADKRVEPLIAVTENGNYPYSDEDESEGFSAYMSLAEEYVARQLANVNDLPSSGDADDGPVEKTKVWWESSISWIRNIEPMVSVQWGQQFEYGAYCENGIAGCGPIAAAQALTYFKQPTSFSGTYEEYRYGSGLGVQQNDFTVNWDAVCGHKGGLTSQDNCSSDTHNSISKLCRYLGYLSNANYAVGGTSVSFNDLSNAMNRLGFTTKISNYSEKNGTALGDDVILLMAGKDNEKGVSHIWLMDGCKYYRKTDIMYTQKGMELPVIAEKIVTDYYMHHFNWGEHGKCNGWFNDKVFATDRAAESDNSNMNNNLGMNFSTNVLYMQVKR